MISTHHIKEIPFIQLLNAEGELITSDGSDITPDIANDFDRLRDYYQHMVLIRNLDQKIVALQRTGQMGTYPSCLGHEAIGTIIGFQLAKEDVFVPYYRDQAAQIARGVTMEELMLYWGGDERGNDYQHCREDFPVSVPIATQLTQAIGVASAFKIRKEERVVIVTCGDGATSRGEFYEALNLAGVWQLPVVVVVANNELAISVPIDIQTASETIAHKALAVGIRGERVDGNDAIALHSVIGKAINVARKNRGPTLIEAMTFRLSDHTTADDASRYRSQQRLKSHWKSEPIKRLRNYLQANNAWHEQEETTLIESCSHKIDAAVSNYLGTVKETPDQLIDHLYSELPSELLSQRSQLIEKGGQPL